VYTLLFLYSRSTNQAPIDAQNCAPDSVHVVSPLQPQHESGGRLFFKAGFPQVQLPVVGLGIGEHV